MRTTVPAALFASLITTIAAADILYNNGPFITNPTGGTGTIAGLPISSSDLFNIPGQTFNFSTLGIGATIPAKYRLTAIAEEMRDSLAKARRNDTAVPTESALLLAYIGFQMGDQAMVKEGLTDLRGILIPDPIVATLEGVWLVRKSPAQAPAQSPSVPK